MSDKRVHMAISRGEKYTFSTKFEADYLHKFKNRYQGHFMGPRLTIYRLEARGRPRIMFFQNPIIRYNIYTDTFLYVLEGINHVL